MRRHELIHYLNIKSVHTTEEAQTEHYVRQLGQEHLDKRRESLRDGFKYSTHFVMRGVIDGLDELDEEVEASVRAMREADVFHLPYDICSFEGTMGCMDPDGLHMKVDVIVLCHIRKEDGVLVGHPFYRTRYLGQVRWFDPLCIISFIEKPVVQINFSRNISSDCEEWLQVMSRAAYRFVTTSMVLMASRGVELETVPPPHKLNKKRLAQRKEPIDEYVMIKVPGVKTDDAPFSMSARKSSDERKRTRLHLRRGHVRRQRYGAERSETKIIYIQSTLVGYEDEGVITHLHYEVGQDG